MKKLVLFLLALLPALPGMAQATVNADKNTIVPEETNVVQVTAVAVPEADRQTVAIDPVNYHKAVTLLGHEGPTPNTVEVTVQAVKAVPADVVVKKEAVSVERVVADPALVRPRPVEAEATGTATRQ